MDLAISEGVQEQTCATVRKWLSSPAKIEEALKQTSGMPDLLERTNKLLELQGQMDRYTGNRIELEKRLNDLDAARTKVNETLAAAINPLPALRALLHEIEAERNKVQKALSGKKAESPLATQLLTIINTTQEWEELRSFSHLVQELSDCSLLQQQDLRIVYDSLHRKFSLLEERNKPKGPEFDTGWSLRSVIHRNTNALVLLDGHNVLFRLKDIFEPHYEDGVPRKKARNKLVELVTKLVAKRSHVQFRICFDSPETGVEKILENVWVEYSGGSGEHRADQVIVARLQIKTLASIDQKTFVVTDDREVRRHVLPSGAKYVANDIFAVLLADFKCLE